MTAGPVEVHLDDESRGLVRVGTLHPSFAGRVLASSSFQYDADYLSSPGAFAISPDLPLVSGRIWTPESHSLPGAFEDASPDEWGRRLIEANQAARRKRDPSAPALRGSWDHLLGVSDAARMGALRFRLPGAAEWSSSDTGVANVHEIERILRVAARYEADDASEEEVAYLSGIATSPGGARPKANVLRADGRLALAKLPHSKDEGLDVERWEAVVLVLAERIGLRTPTWTLLRASAEKSLLLLDRFDRTAAGGRRAYLSAASALEIGANDLGRYSYEQFSDVLADLSADPRTDLREMFTRIALTVLVNNVDDHWRNHGFLRQDGGWRLAPLFDVNASTSTGVVHSRPISDRDDPRHRDLGELLATADAYRLTRPAATRIVRETAEQVQAWEGVALELGLPDGERRRMARAFDADRIARALTIE
ncbi:type II toxin-antitoxin system HipA family toxin [Rathayibacter festucae]|uniref:Type II toxin-antitoxin system HipA family toxin n=1 Tax=Rathayibacter festucae TaxID=110937 RepID=A0ABX6H2B1_9MICO|nr:type II toxin-antitoxin system HipA family toxin [Rathayibacter festucae]QHC63944.1 type II toxin-antitoxin system HipA family toxin [Rathayibacter festucae]